MIIGKIEGDTLLGGILQGFVPPIFLIVLVLGSIFAGWATPTEAAGVGAFGSLILAIVNRTLSYEVLRDVVHRTALTTAMIFFIFVGATAFSTIFRNVYGEDLIIDFIEWLEFGPWPLLFMLMFSVFILGFFFDWIEITLIILPVFAPVIKAMAPAFAPHLADILPDAAFRLRAVLHEGRGAERGENAGDLSRHHPLRDPAVDRVGVCGGVPEYHPLAARDHAGIGAVTSRDQAPRSRVVSAGRVRAITRPFEITASRSGRSRIASIGSAASSTTRLASAPGRRPISVSPMIPAGPVVTIS
jgi:hypothetical protein